MLFKDLIKIYKVYYVHVTEVLERFPALEYAVAEKAFVMYTNFVNLTDAIRNRANKLIFAFNFPIQLPDFYKPEAGLKDTLKVVLKSLKHPEKDGGDKDGRGEKKIKKLNHGMNSKVFDGKDDDVQYCDADVLNAFDKDGNAVNSGDAKELEFDKYIAPASGTGDLMDFINKSDFSTVGGQNNAPKEEVKKEEIDFMQASEKPAA